jgi:hypothetical protein
MAWETFKRSTRPNTKDPMITLSKSGQIGLNTAITKRLIGDAKFALLLFDKERLLLGIKFLKNSETDAYPIKLTKSKSHGSISGLAFMKTYGVFSEHTQVYPAKFDESARMLVADVSAAAAKEGKKKVKV